MIVHRLHNKKLPWDEKLCPSFNSIMRSYVNKMILWKKNVPVPVTCMNMNYFHVQMFIQCK